MGANSVFLRVVYDSVKIGFSYKMKCVDIFYLVQRIWIWSKCLLL